MCSWLLPAGPPQGLAKMMVGRQHFVQNFSPMENRGCPSLMLLKFRKPMRVTCYSFVATVVQWCAQHSKIFAVENPHRSFFWLTSYWQSVAHLVTYVRFDHCAYGGQRQKTTAIAHNCTSVESLAKFCPGHICAEQHLPWGPSASAPNGYATSEETAYPPRLAAAIALAFLRGMAAKGWSGSQVSLGASEEKLAAAAERAIAGIQSKASRFPAPVSEHERVIVLRSRLPLALPCQPGERIEQPFDVPLHVTAQPTCRQVPAKSQLLRSVPITVKLGVREVGKSCGSSPEYGHEQAWGVPHSGEGFVEAAVKAGHPQNFRELLPCLSTSP